MFSENKTFVPKIFCGLKPVCTAYPSKNLVLLFKTTLSDFHGSLSLTEEQTMPLIKKPEPLIPQEA